MSSNRAKFVVHQVGFETPTWRWKLVNRGTIIAESFRTWPQKAQARRAAEAVAKHASSASIVVDGE